MSSVIKTRRFWFLIADILEFITLIVVDRRFDIQAILFTISATILGSLAAILTISIIVKTDSVVIGILAISIIPLLLTILIFAVLLSIYKPGSNALMEILPYLLIIWGVAVGVGILGIYIDKRR